MKTYLVSANHAKKFQSAEYVYVGTVEANNKKEALEKAKVGEFVQIFIVDPSYSKDFPFKITIENN
jgi:hypothetical protein